MFELVRKQCDEQEIEQSEYLFTRRYHSRATGLGAKQLTHSLQRLMEMEYVVAHCGRSRSCGSYELLFDGRGREGEPTLCGPIDASKLQTIYTYE